MTAIPRYRLHYGSALLSAGFRPFFLVGALAAVVEIPLSIAAFTGFVHIPTAFSALVWHVHEMVFGFGLAVVAGFLLTAVPNWTGRMPLQGVALAGLAGLWLLGRLAVFVSGWISEVVAAPLDLAFPAALVAVIAREILTGRNWRNLPIIVALALLLCGDLWVHLGTLGVIVDMEGGNRLGVAVLLMLVSFVGGRLVPSFTRNWLARVRPTSPMPSPFGVIDRMALAVTALALLGWIIAPDAAVTSSVAIFAGALLLGRLARWRGWRTWPEPLLFVLHLGYAWLAGGFLVLGIAGLTGWLAPADAVHALTVGAIGTMTLAVMTRATLGHTGRALHAGGGTVAAYGLVSLAALLRLVAFRAGADMPWLLWLAGAAWVAAFALFAALYVGPLTRPRTRTSESR